MTYGEVNNDLRAAVADLFGYRRITYYLGASSNGAAPAWGSPEQAQASADLVQRYRVLVWKYAQRVAQTANPPGASAPVWKLPLRLAALMDENAPTAGMLPGGRGANLEELATRQPVELVEVWRRAAAAAVIGMDRELVTLGGQLERQQRLVLIKDAAELSLALIRLDRRYRWAPGWRLLGVGGRPADMQHALPRGHRLATGLVSTAFLTVDWATEHITDNAYIVDQLGWRPRPTLIESTSTDPVDTAIGALHNTAVHLQLEFPRALALRGLSRLSRLTSLHAARLAEFAGALNAKQTFDQRARAYSALNSILRTSIGGNLGRGDHAVGEATIALNHLAGTQAASREQIERLLDECDGIDEAISTRLRHGIDNHRYFIANGRHLAARADSGVYRSVPHYEAVTGPTCSELLGLAKTLQRVPGPPPADFDLVDARQQLAALLAPPAEPPRSGATAEKESITTPRPPITVHMPRETEPAVVM